MGCLAGPVVAAAVIFARERPTPPGIDDSKKLSAKRRETLANEIQETALATAVGWAGVSEIDYLNILQAARLAMKRAVEQLKTRPHFLLVDGRTSVDVSIPQKSIVRGDQKSISIAAASIVAKVYRDRWMVALDSEYPGYGLAKHKGYGSFEHRRHLTILGRSPIHRNSFSFAPVKTERPVD